MGSTFGPRKICHENDTDENDDDTENLDKVLEQVWRATLMMKGMRSSDFAAETAETSLPAPEVKADLPSAGPSPSPSLATMEESGSPAETRPSHPHRKSRESRAFQQRGEQRGRSAVPQPSRRRRRTPTQLKS